MKKVLLLTVFAFICSFASAQVTGVINMYKACLFELGQDLSKPLSELNYSLIKKGKEVEILGVDTADVFHATVKYKNKIGIIHTSVLQDRSILIPLFPQIREEFIDNIMKGIPALGMNETEVGMMIGINPQIQTSDDIIGNKYHELYNHPNVTRWYYTSIGGNLGDFFFYKGKLCKVRDRYHKYVIIGYDISYDLRLVEVSRSKSVAGTNNTMQSEITGVKELGYTYEDENIRISWFPQSASFKFTIENKTSYTIRLSWDDMSFIDASGNSGRVINGETRKLYAEREQPESIVPKGSKFSAIAVPYSQNKLIGSSYLCPEEAEDMSYPELGSKIKILFPVKIKDDSEEYTFEFEVKDVYIYPTAD